MKLKGWDHTAMTNKQREMFKKLEKSGAENNLEAHNLIAIEALQTGGASYDEAVELADQSIVNLFEQGADVPSHIPWSMK